MLPSHNELSHLSMGYALLRGRFLRITQPFATHLRGFDLHTLSTPLAFTLNQDQILNKSFLLENFHKCVSGRLAASVLFAF